MQQLQLAVVRHKFVQHYTKRHYHSYFPTTDFGKTWETSCSLHEPAGVSRILSWILCIPASATVWMANP